MIVALGVAWILDGLEITIASTVASTFTDKDVLGLSSGAVGLIATVYLMGEVTGALVYGRLSAKLGRKNLFTVTLGIYLVGSGLTALTFGSSLWWVGFLYLTRFIAGVGIGGEYAAINSAIDEMMPARFRGRVDIAVNGTYWAGATPGHRRLAGLSQRPVEERRSAARLPARLRLHPRTPAPAGKSPLAHHERARGGGRDREDGEVGA